MIVSDNGRRALTDGAFIVIDLGKTLAKVSLWNRAGRRLDLRTRPNVAADGVLDVGGIAGWLVDALGAFAAHPVEAIVPVGHGAAIAALRDGALAFAPLDYEAAIPAEVVERYRWSRDPFAVTGSPALPHGLNLGTQLWWLAERGQPKPALTLLVPSSRTLPRQPKRSWTAQELWDISRQGHTTSIRTRG